MTEVQIDENLLHRIADRTGESSSAPPTAPHCGASSTASTSSRSRRSITPPSAGIASCSTRCCWAPPPCSRSPAWRGRRACGWRRHDLRRPALAARAAGAARRGAARSLEHRARPRAHRPPGGPLPVVTGAPASGRALAQGAARAAAARRHRSGAGARATAVGDRAREGGARGRRRGAGARQPPARWPPRTCRPTASSWLDRRWPRWWRASRATASRWWPSRTRAYPLSPLTLDADALGLFLDTVEPGIVPSPGTSLGTGIARGLELFVDQGRRNKVMVLISDGEDLEGGVDEAVQTRQVGRRGGALRRRGYRGRTAGARLRRATAGV